ncbi:MAG: type II toxin-antitoxin system VapC family toxin [Streptosporangiaceae bacterium]|nr:type II toxin-antitoxin system VapC family toxin [Streptosporangiaceae bacterium]
MTVVLDSWAVLTMLQDGPDASRVARELERGPIMSWINLGEVLYILRRRYGSGEADATVRDLCRVLHAELPPEAVVRAAAAIKAEHRMSYAGAFAVATALRHDGELWTGDPELLVPAAPWRPVDLRASVP